MDEATTEIDSRDEGETLAMEGKDVATRDVCLSETVNEGDACDEMGESDELVGSDVVTADVLVPLATVRLGEESREAVVMDGTEEIPGEIVLLSPALLDAGEDTGSGVKTVTDEEDVMETNVGTADVVVTGVLC